METTDMTTFKKASGSLFALGLGLGFGFMGNGFALLEMLCALPDFAP